MLHTYEYLKFIYTDLTKPNKMNYEELIASNFLQLLQLLVLT
jgi:hypothetical protein